MLPQGGESATRQIAHVSCDASIAGQPNMVHLWFGIELTPGSTHSTCDSDASVAIVVKGQHA